MVNKVKYPIEAFALAMVLCSSSMKVAMLVGIALLAGDVLSHVLCEKLGNKQTAGIAGALGTAMFLALALGLNHVTLELKVILTIAVLAALVGKHVLDVEESDYDDVLFGDSIAYGALVMVAIVREYLANAAIFGYGLSAATVGSKAYGNAMMGLILGGLALALVNKILKTNGNKNAALWVCVPTILLEVPFVLKNVPEVLGMIVGMVVVGVMYYTFRNKLTFSDTCENAKEVPVEMVLLGMIYMVVTIL